MLIICLLLQLSCVVPNLIDSNLLIPFSSIVIPYTVSAASIVPFLCVITKNCDALLNFFRYSANLYTFTSSSAASISSNMQNGAGFIFSIANSSAIAVNAFSPPDSLKFFSCWLNSYVYPTF